MSDNVEIRADACRKWSSRHDISEGIVCLFVYTRVLDLLTEFEKNWEFQSRWEWSFNKCPDENLSWRQRQTLPDIGDKCRWLYSVVYKHHKLII